MKTLLLLLLFPLSVFAQKISELPAASALDGSESVPAVQSGTTTKATINQVGTKILNSPTLTGTVTVPTPAALDNTTKAASTAYVQSNALVKGTSPTNGMYPTNNLY